MQRLLKNRELLLAGIIIVMIAAFSTRAQNFATPVISARSLTTRPS